MAAALGLGTLLAMTAGASAATILRVMHDGDPSDVANFELVAKNFEAANPDVDVQLIYAAHDEFAQKFFGFGHSARADYKLAFAGVERGSVSWRIWRCTKGLNYPMEWSSENFVSRRFSGTVGGSGANVESSESTVQAGET